MTTLQELLLTFHILAAMLWIGGGVLAIVLGAIFARGEDPAPLARHCAALGKIGGPFFGGSGVVVLLTGGWLVADLDLEFSTLWVTLGVIGWLVSFVLGAAVVGRAWVGVGKQLATASDVASCSAAIGRAQLLSWIDLAVRIAVVFVMVFRPA